MCKTKDSENSIKRLCFVSTEAITKTKVLMNEKCRKEKYSCFENACTGAETFKQFIKTFYVVFIVFIYTFYQFNEVCFENFILLMDYLLYFGLFTIKIFRNSFF